MKRLRWPIYTFLSAWLLCNAFNAGATVVIDPESGWTGSFQWTGGLGRIDSIDYTFNYDWSINAAQDSQMSFATAYDWFLPGDEFALVLDGTPIAWGTTYVDTYGYFHGELTDLLLSAGTHFFTINVTTLGSGFTSGGGFAQFSGLTEVAATVPEPGILSLLGFALLLLLRQDHLPRRIRRINAESSFPFRWISAVSRPQAITA